MSTSIKMITKNTSKNAAARKPTVLDVYSPSRSEGEMQDWLNGRIIGQADAVSAAVRMKTMAMSRLRTSDKAAGLYYLVGEPGVGKTELVKALAMFLHGSPKAYVKIDGASLKDKSDVTRLIGASPKYVGYEDPKDTEAREAKEAKEAAADPDNLARKYRKNPRKLLSRKNLVNSRLGSTMPLTILFVDEAEKLNPEIDDLFLNSVEDGLMMLGDNEEVDFTDVLVIFAGNPGSKEAVSRKQPIGFREETASDKETATLDIIMGALKERYRPEMLDRFDEFVYFKKLVKDDLRTITGLRINEVINKYLETMERGTAFTVDVETSARDFILDQALKNTGNARRIGRAVRKYLTMPLNRLIDLAADADNETQILAGDLVRIAYDPQYHGGDLLKFELIEDGAPIAPQDMLAPDAKRDTPLAMKHAAFDRALTNAASSARGAQLKRVSVKLTLPSKLALLQEWASATEEAKEILRMKLVEVHTRMEAPFALTIFYEVSDTQAQLLKAHYAEAEFTVIGDVEAKRRRVRTVTKK